MRPVNEITALMYMASDFPHKVPRELRKICVRKAVIVPFPRPANLCRQNTLSGDGDVKTKEKNFFFSTGIARRGREGSLQVPMEI